MADKIFAKGLFIKERTFNWGKITALSFKTEDFIAFLQENTNAEGYCNVDVKTAINDPSKFYGELNTYSSESRTETQTTAPAPASNPDEEDDLPF